MQSLGGSDHQSSPFIKLLREMRARVHLVLSIYKPNYQTVSAQAQCLSSLSENKYCRKKQKMAGDKKYQPTSKAELKSWQVEILHARC